MPVKLKPIQIKQLAERKSPFTGLYHPNLSLASCHKLFISPHKSAFLYSIILLLISLATDVHGQKTPDTEFKPDTISVSKSNPDSYRRSFFAELAGNSFGVTGNYDRRFKSNRNDGWGFRAGAGIGSYYFTPEHVRRYIAVPLGINYILGKRRSGLESGIGFTTQFATSNVAFGDPSVMLIGVYNLGYRFQPLGSDLMFRAGWSPIFNRHGFFPGWAGVSIGYSLFRKDNRKITITEPKRQTVIALDDGKYKFWKDIGIGARFTPTFYRAAYINNPSPSNVYGPRHSSIDLGIYALRYFKDDRWGIKMGLDFGLIPWLVGVDAPMNAFGDGSGGDRQLNFGIGTNDFSYKALTISSVYKIPIKRRFLEISAGASIRDYAYGDGPDGVSVKFGRSTAPYEADDVTAEIRSLDEQFHISFPLAVDYVFRTGNRSQLKFGITNNIAVKPLYGDLTIIMYGDTYRGKYSPRTSFWGANAVFEYSLNKNAGNNRKKEIPSTEVTGKFRKSFYVESHGSGIFLSGHFDTRLKKDVNNGFGLRAGFGIGDPYYTTVTNDNKPSSGRAISLPVGINYILGKKRHGLEAGVGFTAQIARDNVREGFPAVKHLFPYHIGYRFQPKKEGLVARVALTPIKDKFRYWSNFEYIFYNTGISLGYSFK